jgi:hypothetical protein
MISFSILSLSLYQLLGTSWERIVPYPSNIAEAIGGVINSIPNSSKQQDLIVVSGFSNTWFNVSRKVYALNVSSTTVATTWREMDDVPVPVGFSHSGCVIDGNILYLCGGYVGPNPGKETNVCLQYTHSNKRGTQWKYLPPLPQGRAGGSLLHFKTTNSLVFTSGATRSDPSNIWKSTDHTDSWELVLNNTAGGWMARSPIPYKANHVSYASVPYHRGSQKHFVLGGQAAENEGTGNVADLFEYDSSNKRWIRRTNIPFPRGHSSSSTIPIPGCGFIVAGGAINGAYPKGHYQTTDISYYDILSNTWTKVGDLPTKVNTPVCDIAQLSNGNNYLYCQTGKVDQPSPFRRQIIF